MNSAHLLSDLVTEMERLKRKNRNYKQAIRHLTKAYDTVRFENVALKSTTVAVPQQPIVLKSVA